MALHLTYFPDSDYTVMSLLLEEEAAQKAAEEAAAAAAAEKEAKGYETGITYDQFARTPDDYKGKKINSTEKSFGLWKEMEPYKYVWR